MHQAYQLNFVIQARGRFAHFWSFVGVGRLQKRTKKEYIQ